MPPAARERLRASTRLRPHSSEEWDTRRGLGQRKKELVTMATLDVFDVFTRDYAREKFESMSLEGLAPGGARRQDALRDAGRAHGGGAGRARAGRHRAGRAPRTAVLQPHHQDVSRLRGLLWDGRHHRAHRRLFQACGAGPRGEAPDPLSARPRRRRQVLARRAAQGADGEAPDLCAESGQRDLAGVRKPARPVSAPAS